MEKQRKNRYTQVSRQVDQLRRLYSGIGEPLSVDIIIDLHHHLGKALEIGAECKPAAKRGAKRRLDA